MESKSITFQVIENSGPNNLRDILKAYLSKSSKVSIAAAFVTAAGLSEIASSLRRVAAAHGKVQLITGLYQQVTEPKALRTLLRIQRETRGKCEIRLSKEPQFHRKLFLIERGTRATAIIGSSNLTREGLRSSGELDLMASFPQYHSSYNELKRAFEKDWSRHHSVPLTSGLIKRYEKVRQVHAFQKGIFKGKLRDILGSRPSHGSASPQDEVNGIWRDGIDYIVQKSTQNIINETTNWEERNYEWYCTGGPTPYNEGDKIYLFDFVDKLLRLVKVKDHQEIRTKDGRYFVAFKQVRNYSRRFSDRLWRQLKNMGIGKRNAHKRRKVRNEAGEQLRIILRKIKRA